MLLASAKGSNDCSPSHAARRQVAGHKAFIVAVGGEPCGVMSATMPAKEVSRISGVFLLFLPEFNFLLPPEKDAWCWNQGTAHRLLV
jgi:hypothetical protein